MNTYWRGKNAIVTGAASGIGHALAAGLAERGARVWAADIDSAGVGKTALSIGTGVTPVTLDVRDADAFRKFIEEVAQEAGGIDFLFNNAGILHSGELCAFDSLQCDAIIDVNIRGVVNGTLAAYPLMVRQRHGHIVNMASLAGLVPSPLLSTYSMTKHAVIGLTTSLRYEAERYGVRVSAICPAGVETPLLDDKPASGAGDGQWHPDLRRYLSLAGGCLLTADQVAREALRGVERNKALVIIPARARLTVVAYRFVPGLVVAFGRRVIALVTR